MCLHDEKGKTFLGEKSAKALIDFFKNPFSVFMAEEGEIASVKGFGKKTEEKIFRAIGRETDEQN
jgi:excinuclease UvrABC nuclease subunit